MVIIKSDPIFKEFKPDYTPEALFSKGAFGGTYFRPIYSAVLGLDCFGDHLEFSWMSRVPLHLLVSSVYDPSVNYYGVSCGSSLEFWQHKGWIKAPDFRGWVHWYCRYYAGRRNFDDQRQIKRWISIKKRFGGLKEKSLKVKQVLLHWAIAS